MEETVIILKLEKHRDFILWCLSPTFGKLICIHKAQKGFVEPGLFRVMRFKLEKQVNRSRLNVDEDGLFKVIESQLVHSYDDLAHNNTALQNACELSQLVLSLMTKEQRFPHLFKVVLQAMEAFLEGGMYLPWRVCVLINFMLEFGALPGLDFFDDKQQKFMKALNECGEDRNSLPKLNMDKWAQFDEWALKILADNGLYFDI